MNDGEKTGSTLSDKSIVICQCITCEARPYTKNDQELGYLDWFEDDDRVGATFGPHPPCNQENE